MIVAPIPENEITRLQNLEDYVVLDPLPEADFDGITQLAAVICNVPVCLITFVDENKNIFKSHHGTELTESPRDISFCGHAILSSEPFIVSNPLEDERFYDNPLVVGETQVNFYAGFPLISQSGYALGTLCVMDLNSRQLDENQISSMKLLSQQVMKLLELRRKNAQLEASKNAYQSLFDQNPDGVFSFDLTGKFISANAAMLKMVDNTADNLANSRFTKYVSNQSLAMVKEAFEKALAGMPQNYNVQLISAKGKRRMVNITNIPNVRNGIVIGVFGIAKDITEKHDLQENLSMVLNNTRESFMLVDRDRKIVFFNSSAFNGAKNYLHEEIFRGKNALDLSSAHNAENLSKLYDQVFDGQLANTEISVDTIQGPIYISIAFTPVFAEDGKINYAIVTTVNITDRKLSVLKVEKSIELLKKNEQKTQFIMAGSLDSIIWMDLSAKITFWNPQSEKIFGYTQAEALGKDLIQLIAAPDIRDQLYKFIHNYIEYNDESLLNILLEKMAVNKNQEEFPIEVTIIPIINDNEISFCLFVRDISERIKLNNQLKLSEEQYRSLFYLSPLPMYVYDVESLEILDVNDAAVRHYGYSYDEFLSMTFNELRPEDELGTFEKTLSFVKKSVVFQRGDFQHVKKNGELIDVDVQSNMINYNGKTARLILAIDITRERNNERELKNLTLSLEQKVKERTAELDDANTSLSYQNQQTADSIEYAQNIQNSILHREYDVLKMFKDSFVLFKPKDKVSGDFFWCHETEDYHLVAVLDCTGHGVPSAMISMVGFQLLNQIVVINKKTSPASVLERLDKEISTLFNQSQEDSSADGMDMIYCRIHKKTNKLDYSGAQRPLFIYSGGELEELKGNKLSIGGRTNYYDKKVFEANTITFQDGDFLYLTSDGYYSQFGGPRNKLMLKMRMKEVICEVALLPGAEQLKALENYYQEWRGEEEQVDDILILGVRLGK